jgi:glycosidase
MRKEKYGPHGAFHGYWVEDLEAIEPAFGGEPALRAFAKALHGRGMKLLLDVVLNHAAPDGKLVKRKPEWFHQQGGITDFSDPEQLVTRDVHGLPDLAQDKPEVYSYLLNGSLKWLGPGLADGLRLDAVKHMPSSFWRKFRSDVKARAGRAAFLLGEELEGDPKKLSAAWKAGGFDALFDFPFGFALNDVFCRGAAPERLAAVLSNDRLYPDPSALVTLLDNHDLPRVMSVCGGDAEKVKAALTVLFTARGIPSIQYGTEAGLKGEKEPENRGDMTFERGPLYLHLRALFALRKRWPSLSTGVPVTVAAGDRFLAMGRVGSTERALIAINSGSAPRALTLEGKGWLEPLASHFVQTETVTVKPGEVRVWVRPGDFAAEAKEADAQWRTGAVKRKVVFQLTPGAKVTGSGPELGFWTPSSAVTEAELPVGGVFEFKVVRSEQWEQRDNRVLFVERGEGPLTVKVD